MADIDTSQVGAQGAAAVPQGSSQLRAHRFDRADFAARQSLRMPSADVQSIAQPVADAKQAVSTAGQTPSDSPQEAPIGDAQQTADHLSDLGWPQKKIQQILGGPAQSDATAKGSTSASAQVGAYLSSLGWSQSDIARLLVGPDQAHLTAEALFRQHAANSDGAQAALLKALSQVGAQSVKPDPSLLGGLDLAHLQPEAPLDPAQIISQFAALPDVQKQRFLLLLDSQKANKKTSASKPGDAAKQASSDGGVIPVVKSSIDLLSTALKGLLGDDKGGTKKKGSVAPKGTSPKKSGGDDSESDDLPNQPDKASEKSISDGADDLPSALDKDGEAYEPEISVDAEGESDSESAPD